MDPQTLTHALAGFGAWAIFAGFAISIAIQILLTWFVSWFVTPETATFRNALRYYVFMFVFAFTMVLVFFVLMVAGVFLGRFFDPKFGMPAALAVTAFILFSIALIVGVFAIAMKIYQIGVLRTFGFHLVKFVASLCIVLISNTVLPRESAEARQARVQAFHQALDALINHKALPTAPIPTASPEPASAKVPTQPRPFPSEVALIEMVQIPVVVDGRNAGDVTLQPGTRVKLISVVGDQLKIQYMDTVTMIPRKSTDYKSDETP